MKKEIIIKLGVKCVYYFQWLNAFYIMLHYVITFYDQYSNYIYRKYKNSVFVLQYYKIEMCIVDVKKYIKNFSMDTPVRS